MSFETFAFIVWPIAALSAVAAFGWLINRNIDFSASTHHASEPQDMKIRAEKVVLTGPVTVAGPAKTRDEKAELIRRVARYSRSSKEGKQQYRKG